jgi:Flp pilus assembly protein TadD
VQHRVSLMRISILMRATGLGLALLTGACSTFPGLEDDVAATSTAPVAPDLAKDDLGLGKMHFARGHYGLAEMHFRRAVETAPRQAEAWLGLAASYDQLKRWDMADRAYGQALKITGPTTALLNNRGYSYLLRGDFKRASQDLSAAAAQEPENEQIQLNLQALDAKVRKRA